MLSSIHPLGERGRGHRFATTATAFVVGSLVGGTTTGVVVGGVGRLPAILGAADPRPATSLTVVATVGAVALVFDLTGHRLPSVHRQVNEDWLTEFRGWVYGFGFGVQLGAGVTTYITSTAVAVWLATMAFSGSLMSSVVIGATFGLVRGLSILAARRIDSPARLVEFHRALQRSAPTVARIGSVSLGFLVVAAGFLAITE